VPAPPVPPAGGRLAGPALGAAAVLGFLAYATAAAAALSGAGQRWWWVAVVGGTTAWLAGAAIVSRARGPRVLLLIVVAGALYRIVLVPTAPVLSDDAYRYLWDGRVTAAGIDPYAHAPTAPQLSDLRDDDIWPRVNRPTERTIYPPLAQALFTATWRLGLRTTTTWKLLVVVVDVAATALIAVALTRAGRDPRRVVGYAWNPLPVLAFGHAGHVDAFVVLAAVIAVLAWQAERVRGLALALGVAAGLKLVPLLVLPAFLRARAGSWSWSRATAVAGGAVGIVALSYLGPLAAGSRVLGYLSEGYLDEEGYAAGELPVLGGVGLRGVAALAVGAVLLSIVAIAALRSRREAAARAAWLLGAAVVLTSPYPWYATLLTAMAVAGGAGWIWPVVGVALDVAYLGILLETGFPSEALRFGTGAAVVVMAIAAPVYRRARAAVIGTPAHGASGVGP